MTESPLATVDALVKQAWRSRLVTYSHVEEDTVVLQIGRVVYALSRARAAALLAEALGSVALARRGRFEAFTG